MYRIIGLVTVLNIGVNGVTAQHVTGVDAKAVVGSASISGSSVGSASWSSHPSSTTTPTTGPAPTNDAVILNLTTTHINATLPHITIDGHEIPVTCLNCSTVGALQVSGSELKWNSNLLGASDALGFSGGVVRAELPDGLKGHIELGLTPLSTLSHVFHILTLPVAGIAIPGVTDAGVTVGLSIPLMIQLKESAEVSFGFEFEIPAHSFLLIDVAEPHKSTVQGFGKGNEPNFNLLPVNVTKPGLDVKITTGLELDLTLGADLLDHDVSANIGATLQIPQISIEELQLSNVDNKCNAVKNSTTAAASPTHGKAHTTQLPNVRPRSVPDDLLGNYTNIIPSVGIDLNVFVEAGLHGSLKGHEHELGTQTDVPIFKTTLSQTSTCINNDKPTSTSSKTATTAPNTTAKPTGPQSGAKGTATATTTSGASRSSAQRDSEGAFVLMSGSTALALAIAMGILVVSF